MGRGGERNVLLGARLESSSAFQYFLICESETFAALDRTSSRPSLFRFVLRFGAVDLVLVGESRTITFAVSGDVSIVASGSGVEMAVTALSAGCWESFDFFTCSVVLMLAFVTLEALLLNERVDCWEDWEDSAVGAGALRRVAGMVAVGWNMLWSQIWG